MIELGLGALLGFGLWMLVDGGNHRSVAARLAPHLRDVSAGARVGSVARGLVDILAAIRPSPLRFAVAWWRNRPSARKRLIDSELPSILDRMSVCLAAGLAIGDTFERVGSNSIGILGLEARAIARDVSVGVPLSDACANSERRVRHESWSTLIEHLLGARRHGTPIADIIRSLAADERAAAGRRLLKAASSREVVMLLPLVFVILPMTVLVAVFPGLVALGSLRV